MRAFDFFNHIVIDEYSVVPKYLQLVNSILSGIEAGKIKKNDFLPSLNELNFNYELSRDTVNKGYKYLKEVGIINSIPRKGYYIANADFRQTLKICLLFNKLSDHKKIIYDAFVESIGDRIPIDFYIYNNDFNFFKKIISKVGKDYSHYVIIPHFYEGEEFAYKIINSIAPEKLVLLDKILPGIQGEYTAVYENFEMDIFQALEQARKRLNKYTTLKIVFPPQSYFPKEILRGFFRFCQKYNFSHQVVNDIRNEPINEGEVYICLMEDDLVVLVERVIDLKLKIGKEIGIISYNETPLKSLIVKGITTISTDFKLMGSMAAKFIIDNSRSKIEVPFYLTLRPSI